MRQSLSERLRSPGDLRTRLRDLLIHATGRPGRGHPEWVLARDRRRGQSEA